MLFSPALLPGLFTPGAGGPPAGPQPWPTNNLLWSLDPDDSAHRTVVNVSGTDYVQRLTDPVNATFYAENTDASRPRFETKNGRGVATFSGAQLLYLTAELVAQFGALNAAHTFHAVHYRPAVANGFPQSVVGAYAATGTNMRHTYEFTGDEHLFLGTTDAGWASGNATGTGDDPDVYGRGVPKLFTWRVNANRSVDFFVDGVMVSDDGGSVVDSTMATDGLWGTIGHNRFNGTDGQYLEGSLGALLWYTVAQTDSAIAALATVKAGRYA